MLRRDELVQPKYIDDLENSLNMSMVFGLEFLEEFINFGEFLTFKDESYLFNLTERK